MSEKKPKVKRLRGRVSIFIIGLRKILNKLKHAPTIKAIQIGSIEIPTTTFDATHTEIEIKIQCKMIFI